MAETWDELRSEGVKRLFTASAAASILRRHGSGATIRSLADEYNVQYERIWDIAHGRTYRRRRFGQPGYVMTALPSPDGRNSPKWQAEVAAFGPRQARDRANLPELTEEWDRQYAVGVALWLAGNTDMPTVARSA